MTNLSLVNVIANCTTAFSGLGLLIQLEKLIPLKEQLKLQLNLKSNEHTRTSIH